MKYFEFKRWHILCKKILSQKKKRLEEKQRMTKVKKSTIPKRGRLIRFDAKFMKKEVASFIQEAHRKFPAAPQKDNGNK